MIPTGIIRQGNLDEHMITCLIVGFQKEGHKAHKTSSLISSGKITQILYENLAQFPAKLKEALRKYTNLGPTSAGGTIVLNIHFISQSSPDIRKKLKKAEVPQTPQQDLLNLAFKSFNNREE